MYQLQTLVVQKFAEHRVAGRDDYVIGIAAVKALQHFIGGGILLVFELYAGRPLQVGDHFRVDVVSPIVNLEHFLCLNSR